MALERTNPLPIGVYWVDVIDSRQPAFREWLTRNAETTDVLSTKSFESRGGWEALDWYLFRVTAPTTWEGPGFPTIAERGESTTPDDTVQKPPPRKDILDEITDEAAKPIGKALGFGMLLGAGWLLYKVASQKPGRK